MGHPRSFTLLLLLALLLVLSVPAAASAGLWESTAVDDSLNYQVVPVFKPIPEAGAEFGYSVASNGECVAVGARYETVGGQANAGAVYIYRYSEYEEAWALLLKVTAPTPTAGARFGQSVALTRSTLVIGAPYEVVDGKADAGCAYVYGGNGSDRWSLETRITASEPQAYDRFGDGVAASEGDIVVVGARGRYSDPSVVTTEKTGAAFVFTRSLSDWSESMKLTDTAGGPGHEFGASVGVDPWGIYVGAPGGAGVTGDTSGKVCVFRRDLPYLQEYDLAISGLAAGDQFGGDICSFEVWDWDTEEYIPHLLVTASGNLADFPDQPVVYSYDHPSGDIDDPWVFAGSSSAADPGPMSAFTGSDMAVGDFGMFVGMNTMVDDGKASSGAVYFYHEPVDLKTPYQIPLTVMAPGVLANDFVPTFVLAGTAGWEAVKVSDPENGRVTLLEDGSFTYDPDPGFSGTDSFTYKFTAPLAAESNVATVTILVEDPYTLTYKAEKGGRISGEKVQHVGDGGDGTPVTAVADAGYKFVEWSDGLESATRQETDVKEDLTVTARFTSTRTKVCLSAPIGWMRPKVGVSYLYSGTMSPRATPDRRLVKVVVQRKVDGVWRSYRSVMALTKKLSTSQSKYVLAFTFGKRGAYRLSGRVDTATRYGRSAWTYLRTK